MFCEALIIDAHCQQLLNYMGGFKWMVKTSRKDMDIVRFFAKNNYWHCSVMVAFGEDTTFNARFMIGNSPSDFDPGEIDPDFLLPSRE